MLYARGSDVQRPPLRHGPAEHGPPWSRALLACARTCDRHGHTALADDLAAWMA